MVIYPDFWVEVWINYLLLTSGKFDFKVPEVSIKAQQMPHSGEVFMLHYVSSLQWKVRPRR